MVKTPFCFHFVHFSPLFLTHKFAQRRHLFIVMSVRWFSKGHRLVLSRTLQLHLIKSVLFGFSKPAPQPHPNAHVGALGGGAEEDITVVSQACSCANTHSRGWYNYYGDGICFCVH